MEARVKNITLHSLFLIGVINCIMILYFFGREHSNTPYYVLHKCYYFILALTLLVGSNIFEISVNLQLNLENDAFWEGIIPLV
jgi:hypothetical protein